MYASYYDQYPRQYSFDAAYQHPPPVQQQHLHAYNNSHTVPNALTPNNKPHSTFKSDREVTKAVIRTVATAKVNRAKTRESYYYSSESDENASSPEARARNVVNMDGTVKFLKSESEYFRNSLAKLHSKLDAVLVNQNKIVSKMDHLDRAVKSGGGTLTTDLVKEIRDALNIDFDIDLEVQPEDNLNKFSIKSIKEYKGANK